MKITAKQRREAMRAINTMADDHTFFCAAESELYNARKLHSPLNSSHEAYAVILEEVDEFWDEVRKKRSERDPGAMRKELIQIAAMACRAANDVVAKMPVKNHPTTTHHQ